MSAPFAAWGWRRVYQRAACVVWLVLCLCGGVFAAPAKTAPRLTVYSDGLSCPGGCDAHVVFAKSLNGTAHAHHPESNAKEFKPCIKGEPCRVCLNAEASECLKVTYRGGGPHENTFDFTPAFYEKHCADPGHFPTLDAACAELQRAARSLDGRINCLRQPEHARCAELVATARKEQEKDRALYDECLRVGEESFNRGRSAEQQRSLACAYENTGTGGPNSKGKRWRKLLPGACPAGSFVGRDGTDCCAGVPFVDGPLGRECRAFYPLAE